MYQAIHSSKYHSLFRSFALCVMMCAIGCQEPVYDEPNQSDENNEDNEPPQNYADSYVFDISVLSEWSGNILPYQTTMKFVLRDENNDGQNAKCYLGNSEFDCAFSQTERKETSKLVVSYDRFKYDEIHKRLTKPNEETQDIQSHTLTCTKTACSDLLKDKDLEELELNNLPDGDAKTCLKLIADIHNIDIENPETNPITSQDIADIKNDVGKFSLLDCSWEIGGAADIHALWNELGNMDSTNDETQQLLSKPIRVGIGDNFGVSPYVTSSFDDIPATQMLTMMGMTVDTLGNHSFDESLGYLNKVLDHASYPFIATNLENVPQNLKNTYKYALINVESNVQGKASLPVAFISALDVDTRESVFTGRFGTLGIGNYCAVAQTIEEAYNEGARAFFILGHLTAGEKSLRQVLNAIFSFAEKDKSFEDTDHCRQYINSLQNDPGVPDCPSKLIIPLGRLLERFKTHETLNRVLEDSHIGNYRDFIDTFMVLDPEDPRRILATNVYNQLAREIRHEIYQGIIGIAIEGSDEPIMTQIQLGTEGPESAVSYHCPDTPKTWCGSDETSYMACIQEKSSKILSQSTPLFIRQSSILPDSSKNSIWLMQVPNNGKQIGNLRVQLNNISEDESHAAFAAKSLSYSLTPVLPAKNEDVSKELIVVATCDDIFHNLKTALPQNMNSVFDTCGDVYFKYKDHEISDEKSDKDSNEKSEIDICIDKLKNLYEVDTLPETFFYDMQTFWQCLYAAKEYIQCTDNTVNSYMEKPIFKFVPSIPNTTEIQDRSESTGRTSLVADIILDYVNHYQNENDKFDVVLINAGTVRGTTAMTILANSTIHELVPFENHVKSVDLTVKQLVDLLHQGLNAQIGHPKGTKGGFPVVSGIQYAVEKTDAPENYQITEMWSVDNEGCLKDPLYLDITENEYQGVFAKYKKKTNEETNKDEVQYDIIINENHSCTSDKNITFSKSSHQKNLKLITLDFITTGGDAYKFNDEKVKIGKDNIKNISNLPDNETVLSAIIKNYLSASNDNEDMKCEDLKIQANTKTITNKPAIDLYCRSGLKRYYLTTSDSNASTSSIWIDSYRSYASYDDCTSQSAHEGE